MPWDKLIELLQRLDVTALLTVAVTGYISGKFGVRRGLEQSRNQRAFERRLEWYERTFGAFGKFALNLRKLSLTPVGPNISELLLRNSLNVARRFVLALMKRLYTRREKLWSK